MATINIGNLTFTHKGDYASGTAYVKNDVVYYSTNGNAYIAKQATTGNAPTNATYWNQFAAGSGGIWSGSLSLGSASQQLRVNSGATALEFYTPAAVTSDYVKLVSTDFSNVSSMSLDGYYSSTYDNYRAVISNFYASSGADVHFSFRAGNSQITDSNYQNRVGRITSAGAMDASGQDGAKYRLWYGGSGNSAVRSQLTIDIYNPLATSQRHIMSYRGGTWTSGNVLYHFFGSVTHSTQQAHSGFTLDNFSSGYGTLKLYGIK